MLGYETYAINTSTNHHLSCCDVIAMNLVSGGDGEGEGDAESLLELQAVKKGAPKLMDHKN